jgi:hemoglobin/transferrin/lactoferrin receptor protein
MGLVGRNMAVLLGGAAMTVLLATQAGWAQDAEQTDQTVVVDGESAAAAGQEQATQQAAPPMAGATQLDKITIVSRTGETAIEQMASVSHVDQEQLECLQP